MKRLQSEWKTVGPVRRSKSEVVWNRFRAAADHFFERYHNRHQIALASKLAEREALVVELERSRRNDEPIGDLSRTRAVSSARRGTAACRFRAAEIKPLADRWQAALARIVERQGDAFKGTELDPATIRQRMEKLVAQSRDVPRGCERARPRACRRRSCSPPDSGPRSPATRWAAESTKSQMARGRRRGQRSAIGLAAARSVVDAGSARARCPLPRRRAVA